MGSIKLYSNYPGRHTGVFGTGGLVRWSGDRTGWSGTSNMRFDALKALVWHEWRTSGVDVMSHNVGLMSHNINFTTFEFVCDYYVI